MSLNHRSTKKAFLLLTFIYLGYLTKSVLGINLLQRYSMPRFVKYPLIAADCAVDLKINFCTKASR